MWFECFQKNKRIILNSKSENFYLRILIEKHLLTDLFHYSS